METFRNMCDGVWGVCVCVVVGRFVCVVFVIIINLIYWLYYERNEDLVIIETTDGGGREIEAITLN